MDDFRIDMTSPIAQEVILGAVIIVAIVFLVKVGHFLTKKYVADSSKAYHTRRVVSRVGGFVIFVSLLAVFSPRLGDLLTILTVIGAGLAIAMREALLGPAGWMYVIFQSPYKQGDRIEINGVFGDVIDIRMMRTTVMEIRDWVEADQSTGRIVHFPNGWVFSHSVHNFTRGFGYIWNELSFTLTFRSDWEKAREILLDLGDESAAIVEREAAREIRQLSREYLVHYSILTPFVYVTVVENGVRLSLRYLCEARKRRGTAHAITVSALHAFRNTTGVEFAYPTVNVASLDGPQFGNRDLEIEKAAHGA